MVVVVMGVKLFALTPMCFLKTSMWREVVGGRSYVAALLGLPRPKENRGITDIS